MKNLKFYAIICFCIFVGISCNSTKNNGDSSLEEGEYEETGTEECNRCDGKGVIRIKCSNCNGTGETDSYYYEEGTERIACSSCGGTGGFVCKHCNGTNTRYCDECSGRGVRKCDICKGIGVISMPNIGNTECPSCEGGGLITCYKCNGKKIEQCGYCSDGKVMCEKCMGYGYDVAPTQESGTRKQTCERCEGSRYIEKKCPECDGEGEISIVKIYDSNTNELIRKERR